MGGAIIGGGQKVGGATATGLAGDLLLASATLLLEAVASALFFCSSACQRVRLLSCSRRHSSYCTKWFSSISAVLLFGMTIVMLLLWALENTEGRLPGKSRF